MATLPAPAAGGAAALFGDVVGSSTDDTPYSRFGIPQMIGDLGPGLSIPRPYPPTPPPTPPTPRRASALVPSVRAEIRCQFIILARKDGPTPDYVNCGGIDRRLNRRAHRPRHAAHHSGRGMSPPTGIGGCGGFGLRSNPWGIDGSLSSRLHRAFLRLTAAQHRQQDQSVQNDMSSHGISDLAREGEQLIASKR